MDYNLYFDPVSIQRPGNYTVGKTHFRDNLVIHTESQPIVNREYKIVLIGVPEERNSINVGCSQAPDKVRVMLYQLSKIGANISMADFGNLKSGKTANDTYFAICDVVNELVLNNSIPVIIGGSHDLTYGSYLAFRKSSNPLNLVTFDSRLDVGVSKNEINSYTYLTKILLDKKKHLGNFTNFGHQSYFLDQIDLKLINKLSFKTIRLGEIKPTIHLTEPVLRDADIVSIDMSSVKQSDAPGHAYPSPNGFTGDEICQIAKYAGLSDRVGTFGIYEINPSFDINSQTTHLAAQMIWIFIESVTQRFNENPKINSKNIKKFIIHVNEVNREVVFYKSVKSGRWWIEVYVFSGDKEYSKIIACAEEDYNMACKNELPDRWLKAFQLSR